MSAENATTISETAYATAQTILADIKTATTLLESIQERTLALVDPALSVIVTDGAAAITEGVNAISNVLANTFGQGILTPESIDADARAALDAEFGRVPTPAAGSTK